MIKGGLSSSSQGGGKSIDGWLGVLHGLLYNYRKTAMNIIVYYIPEGRHFEDESERGP